MGDRVSSVIPIFPLPNVVLFPQMPLPLHIFEPRYRKMVADALASHQTIGMTLLRPGWEADYEGRPAVYAVGCAGRIERSELLPDGRYNILLRGEARFRITGERAGEPYRLADAERLVEGRGDAAEVESLRQAVLAALARSSDGPVSLVLQAELSAELFVNAVAQSLDLEPVEKQSLLDCDTIPARYRRLLEILEFLLLERARGGGGIVH
jgi:Lon protease-like protein